MQKSSTSNLSRNPFFIRSIVPTWLGTSKQKAVKPWRRNPFFIRSIVPTEGVLDNSGVQGLSQSLLHQVNRSNRLKRCPSFGRRKVAIPSSSGQSFQRESKSRVSRRPGTVSQSLLHQVNRSNQNRTPVYTGVPRCRNPFFIRSIVPTTGGRRFVCWASVAIPSSSGQSFQRPGYGQNLYPG